MSVNKISFEFYSRIRSLVHTVRSLKNAKRILPFSVIFPLNWKPRSKDFVKSYESFLVLVVPKTRVLGSLFSTMKKWVLNAPLWKSLILQFMSNFCHYYLMNVKKSTKQKKSHGYICQKRKEKARFDLSKPIFSAADIQNLISGTCSRQYIFFYLTSSANPFHPFSGQVSNCTFAQTSVLLKKLSF